MTIDSKTCRVPPSKMVDLSKWPTIINPYFKSKKAYIIANAIRISDHLLASRRK